MYSMYSEYSRVKRNKLYSRYIGCRRTQFVMCQDILSRSRKKKQLNNERHYFECQ